MTVSAKKTSAQWFLQPTNINRLSNYRPVASSPAPAPVADLNSEPPAPVVVVDALAAPLDGVVEMTDMAVVEVVELTEVDMTNWVSNPLASKMIRLPTLSAGSLGSVANGSTRRLDSLSSTISESSSVRGSLRGSVDSNAPRGSALSSGRRFSQRYQSSASMSDFSGAAGPPESFLRAREQLFAAAVEGVVPVQPSAETLAIDSGGGNAVTSAEARGSTTSPTSGIEGSDAPRISRLPSVAPATMTRLAPLLFLFDDAQANIMHLMRTDSYKRFLGSKLFAELAATVTDGTAQSS